MTEEKQVCTGVNCTKELTEAVLKFSMDKYKMPLCVPCQEIFKKKKEEHDNAPLEKNDAVEEKIKDEPKTGLLQASDEEIREYGENTAKELNIKSGPAPVPNKEVIKTAKNETPFKIDKGIPFVAHKTLEDGKLGQPINEIMGFEKEEPTASEPINDGKANSVFMTLRKVDVEKHKKGQFDYASWSDVWDAVKQKYPLANYKVSKNHEGLPYCKDSSGGFVEVTVTIEGLSHTILHPILSYSNKPILSKDINSFDINTSIQRALAKACALHGLGLHIFKGEDLPKEDSK